MTPRTSRTFSAVLTIREPSDDGEYGDLLHRIRLLCEGREYDEDEAPSALGLEVERLNDDRNFV